MPRDRGTNRTTSPITSMSKKTTTKLLIPTRTTTSSRRRRSPSAELSPLLFCPSAFSTDSSQQYVSSAQRAEVDEGVCQHHRQLYHDAVSRGDFTLRDLCDSAGQLTPQQRQLFLPMFSSEPALERWATWNEAAEPAFDSRSWMQELRDESPYTLSVSDRAALASRFAAEAARRQGRSRTTPDVEEAPNRPRTV